MFRPKKKEPQPTLWLPTSEIVQTPANAFFDRLDQVLADAGFHDRVREICKPYYTEGGPGRIGTDPVVYFKMLMVGFFEGIGSERAIAARCADSLSIRHFLRYELTEATPNHSTLSRIRQRLPEEVYQQVFAIVLGALSKYKLVKGKRVGMDASIVEANASMRSLQQRLTKTAYTEYVKQLAEAAGVDSSDDAAVRRFDKNRKKKVSNDDWENPHDPEAKIGRTKHGQTRMVYKPEHVVDLDTGAILDAKVQPGNHGDTEDLCNRLIDAEERMNEAIGLEKDNDTILVVAADKGYHKTSELVELHRVNFKTVIPEREGKRRSDLGKEEKAALRGARRSVEAKYGKELGRRRSELVERSFQHTLDCGGARKTTLRGQTNINKRYLIQAACTNLSLMMRTLFGIGTPKQALAAARALVVLILGYMAGLHRVIRGKRASISNYAARDLNNDWRPPILPAFFQLRPAAA
jgi:transposase